MHLIVSTNADVAGAPASALKDLCRPFTSTFEPFLGQVAPFFPAHDSSVMPHVNNELHQPSQVHRFQL